MKLLFYALALLVASLAYADSPLAEIKLSKDSYDISAFRGYAEEKGVAPLGSNSLRVFYMGAGRVSKAVEISLESGLAKSWPDVFDKSEVKTFNLDHRELSIITSALVEKDLDSIPIRVDPSMDGVCHLLEIRNEKGYYWRLHRNSSSGYFRAMVALVYLAASKNEAK